ncbi:MAG TPA: transcription antitermination factor NusB [bacterium]|nr:transcription antitermination factor NusB [Candidatus Omnitrophota bacterium]HOJ59958.1 transcription antitermination factor NusB [bacterium]HOL94541.1 transcription antitermination factor NusB [bacterium]HPP01851.1 transcription antitermination factor NusB [bacterium]HXK95918.1 transcription antitermination factor NusB [bacterium]
MKHAGPRHVGREYALRILYAYNIQMDVTGEKPVHVFPNWWAEEDSLSVTPEAEQFAWLLTRGVMKKREEIDRLIQEQALHWRLERMSPVDRNILRLSLWELMENSDTPANVILNEAVELAKCYGDENSPRFMNGILDPLARTLRPGEYAPVEA